MLIESQRGELVRRNSVRCTLFDTGGSGYGAPLPVSPSLPKRGWGRFPEIPLAPPFLKGETLPPFPPFGKGGNRRRPGLLSHPLTRYDARLFTWVWATANVLVWTPSAHAH